MGAEDVVAAAFYAIVNMFIPIAFGFLLRKLDVLTKDNRKVLSNMNYYVLVPLYGMIFSMQAIDRNRLKEIGMIYFSSLSSVAVGFVFVLIILWVLRTDIRYRYSLAFVIVYANVIVMPQMIGDSTCEKGGKYVQSFACKSALVKPYASLPLIYCNILYWITVLPILQNEQRIALDTRKIFAFALNYYDTIDHFISDTAMADTRDPKFDETYLKQKQSAAKEPQKIDLSLPPASGSDPASPPKGPEPLSKEERVAHQMMVESGTTLLKEPIALTSDKFIHEYFNRSVSYADYDSILAAFQRLEQRAKSTPEQQKDWQIIREQVVEPAGLLKIRVPEQVLSWKFLKERILMAPPAICSILGLVLGFIFPFKEWLFDVNNKPLPTFLATLSTLGGMMSPISMFLLGASIAEGASIRQDSFVRWKHVIISNIVRFIIIPLIGLLWIFVFYRAIDENLFKANPVLTLICYIFWAIPNGVVLIAVYAFADYFTLEFGILSVYLNIVAAPMMIVFLVIYFSIYETY